MSIIAAAFWPDDRMQKLVSVSAGQTLLQKWMAAGSRAPDSPALGFPAPAHIGAPAAATSVSAAATSTPAPPPAAAAAPGSAAAARPSFPDSNSNYGEFAAIKPNSQKHSPVAPATPAPHASAHPPAAAAARPSFPDSNSNYGEFAAIKPNSQKHNPAAAAPPPIAALPRGCTTPIHHMVPTPDAHYRKIPAVPGIDDPPERWKGQRTSRRWQRKFYVYSSMAEWPEYPGGYQERGDRPNNTSLQEYILKK